MLLKTYHFVKVLFDVSRIQFSPFIAVKNRPPSASLEDQFPESSRR